MGGGAARMPASHLVCVHRIHTHGSAPSVPGSAWKTFTSHIFLSFPVPSPPAARQALKGNRVNTFVVPALPATRSSGGLLVQSPL